MTALDLWDASIPLRVTVALFYLLLLGAGVWLAALLVNRALSQAPAARRYLINLALLSVLFFSLPVVLALEVVRGAKHDIGRPTPRVTLSAEVTVAAPDMTEPAPGLAVSPEDGPPLVPRPTPISRPGTGENDVAISASPSPKELAAPWIAGGYCAGVLVMVVRLLAGLYGGRRLRQAAASIREPWILELVKRQSRALGLLLVPAVACCERVAVPVVVGILRPVILLPLSFVSKLSPKELCDILTHELAHLRRLDHLAVVLQRLTEVLWFFHPAVWYLSRRVSCEREYCCDDLALGAGLERLSYASSLCRVAEIAAVARTSESRALALAADGRRPSELRRRIVRLLEPRRDSTVRLTLSGLIGLATLVAAVSLAPFALPTLIGHWQSAAAADGDTSKLQEQAKSAQAESRTVPDDPKMTGYVADARLPRTKPVVLWKFVSDVVLRPTATADGMVYIATDDGQVIALRATDGSVAWKYAIPGRDDALRRSKWDEINWNVGLGRPSFAIVDYFRVGRPAVDKDYVYFGTPTGVTAVRRDNGKFVWHRDIEHGVLASTPISIGQRVYISGNDGKAYSLHRPTGHVVWQHDLVQDAPADKPGFRGERARVQKARARPMGAACDGKLFIQCVFDQSRIVAIDCLTGEKRWSYEMAGWTAAAPTIDGDRVYIGSQDRTLSCVSLKSGKVLWKFVAPTWLSSCVAVHAGKVYLTCHRGELFQLDAENGRAIGHFVSKEDRDTYSQSPFVDDRAVYFATANGHLFASDVKSLQPTWDVPAIAGTITDPVTDGRRIFVTTRPDTSGAGEHAIVALGDASLAFKQPASRSRRQPSSSRAEPDDVSKHVALIKATETRPRGYASGVSKTFSAVVIASDGTKSTLLST
jgi:outer membrane protein assembly factor BamB/beta-lactamase regulating signal transducer with metallopeptidase domain